MTGARNHATTLPAEEGSVGAACAAARDFASAAGIGDDTGARLCIIVEELVVNLVEYAGLSAPDQLRLEFGWDGRDVRLVMTDPGPPFDPRLAPPPADLPPERGGGAGLAMVRAWAHIESYVRLSGINRLTLRLPG